MSADPAATESKEVVMPKSTRDLDDKTWERLLKRIRDDKCTPVIGSGACTAPPTGADPAEWAKLKYPSKEQIALKFAADYAYPLDDQTKLERVAKYVAATDDIMAPKEAFAEHYGNIATPNFSALPNEPHRVLADLPFPVYLTSNFDDWMYRALREYKQRDARLAIVADVLGFVAQVAHVGFSALTQTADISAFLAVAALDALDATLRRLAAGGARVTTEAAATLDALRGRTGDAPAAPHHAGRLTRASASTVPPLAFSFTSLLCSSCPSSRRASTGLAKPRP